MIHRRKLLFGLIAAPLVIKTPGLLMPIKPVGDRRFIGMDFGTGENYSLVMIINNHKIIWPPDYLSLPEFRQYEQRFLNVNNS